MKKIHITAGAAALTAVLISIGFAYNSFAFNEKDNRDLEMLNKQQKTRLMFGEQRQEKQEKWQEMAVEREIKREAVAKALEAGDYDLWLEAVGAECFIADKINQENFPKLVEAHKLKTQAKKIMEDLGLERKQHKHRGIKFTN